MPRLRSLPILGRLGLLALVFVLFGGLAAAAVHLYWHHEVRDERPGLTMDDITGVYHGVESVAPLLTALRRDHPQELAERERTALLEWLDGDQLSASFDDLELGEDAPAEIIARACLSCHARGSDDPIGADMPLEYWDDISGLAFSRQINPTSPEILVATTHAHALSMATMSIVIALLAFMTSWPRWLIGFLVGLSGLGLLIDLGCWWLARDYVIMVWGIVFAGGVYNVSSGLLLAAIAVDLVLPGGGED